MAAKAFEGIVRNGRIELREKIALPENARVFVYVTETEAKPVAHIRSPRLADPSQAASLRKEVIVE